jgi:6-phosphogluconolactonase
VIKREWIALYFTFSDRECLFSAAADEIIRAGNLAVQTKGIFTLALSGGKTPRRLYELLSSAPRISQMPWIQTHFFWGDERCVIPSDPESNFRMAEETLLFRAPVPLENIHRIHSEKEPHEAAKLYESSLRDFFRFQSKNNSSYFPSFDCILLGIGVEGHIASLFPGSPAIEEHERWVIPVEAPESVHPRCRVTLTLPVINQARLIIFLVIGEGKKETVKKVLCDTVAGNKMPAAMMKPTGEMKWYLDFKV